MPEPTDKPKAADELMRELNDRTIPRPRRESNQTRESPDELGLPPIPKSILDAILDTIAKSIEQALADVITRCVGQGIEQRLRPLAEEIALLRTAIEYDWDDNGQRRRRNHRQRETNNIED
jgi:hypothetical protein